MKKMWLLFFFLFISLALADNIYQQDSLQLQLDIEGEFTLVPENSGASLKEVSAELLLIPQDNFRQKLLEIEHEGTMSASNESIIYQWTDKKIETKYFGYQAKIQTNDDRLKVKTKIPFPLTNIEEYQKYLQPTETIDSDHPLVIAKAAELAEGETDLSKVVFNLASWVDENVEYDLNTLTAGASQKASWVLQKKNGVCDEISTLFIALCRSMGIPARFVSGISYTTSELFEENWQPHGWAEVYFPGVGWVSYDLTFGEYGYVDVTHIKLRDEFDPAEAATKYEWLANKVSLEASQLDLNVIVLKPGSFVPEEVLLEQEILSPQVGFGSYNLVRGILKNTADYYIATTLQLTAPREVEIQGRNKRIILLEPKQVKETYWIIKVAENLDPAFEYRLPMIISTEKNISVIDSFASTATERIYSKEEIEQLTVQDEEKSYSRRVTFSCEYPPGIKQDTEAQASCTIKNGGNTNLQKLNFCLDGTCKKISLLINQEDYLQVNMSTAEVGWKKMIVSAENELVEKKDSLEYIVLDEPKILTEPDYPEKIGYGEDLAVSLKLKKDSFSTPSEIVVILNGLGTETSWELDQLADQEELPLILEQPPISKNNKIEITVMWKDQEGKLYSDKQELLILGEARSTMERIKMMFNGFINLFS